MVEHVIFPRAMQFEFRGGTQLPFRADLNPLNGELNPFCHLLTLPGCW